MSLAMLKHQPSCKMLFCFYEFLIEILTRNISRMNIISLVGIFLCLTFLSSLIVIHVVYSTCLCMLKPYVNHVHTKSLEVKPCLGKKAADEELILTKEEVEMVMMDLGIDDCSLNDKKLREKMGVDDFAAVFEEEEPSLEEVKQAFEMFDVNKDGYIDEKELKSVLCVLGFKITSEVECRKMIHVFDSDCDGRLDFREFVRLIESSFC